MIGAVNSAPPAQQPRVELRLAAARVESPWPVPARALDGLAPAGTRRQRPARLRRPVLDVGLVVRCRVAAGHVARHGRPGSSSWSRPPNLCCTRTAARSSSPCRPVASSRSRSMPGCCSAPRAGSPTTGWPPPTPSGRHGCPRHSSSCRSSCGSPTAASSRPARMPAAMAPSATTYWLLCGIALLLYLVAMVVLLSRPQRAQPALRPDVAEPGGEPAARSHWRQRRGRAGPPAFLPRRPACAWGST